MKRRWRNDTTSHIRMMRTGEYSVHVWSSGEFWTYLGARYAAWRGDRNIRRLPYGDRDVTRTYRL